VIVAYQKSVAEDPAEALKTTHRELNGNGYAIIIAYNTTHSPTTVTRPRTSETTPVPAPTMVVNVAATKTPVVNRPRPIARVRIFVEALRRYPR
jgi:hypothetical protein